MFNNNNKKKKRKKERKNRAKENCQIPCRRLTHVTGLPEKEREKGVERIFEETVAEIFPNLMKGIIINISAQQTPSKMTARRPTTRHNIIKF